MRSSRAPRRPIRAQPARGAPLRPSTRAATKPAYKRSSCAFERASRSTTGVTSGGRTVCRQRNRTSASRAEVTARSRKPRSISASEEGSRKRRVAMDSTAMCLVIRWRRACRGGAPERLWQFSRRLTIASCAKRLRRLTRARFGWPQPRSDSRRRTHSGLGRSAATSMRSRPAKSEEEFREMFVAWSGDNDVELVDAPTVLLLHEFLDAVVPWPRW
jgi:hypothetical protein